LVEASRDQNACVDVQETPFELGGSQLIGADLPRGRPTMQKLGGGYSPTAGCRTCQSKGFTGGSLTCTSSCTISTSTCTGQCGSSEYVCSATNSGGGTSFTCCPCRDADGDGYDLFGYCRGLDGRPPGYSSAGQMGLLASPW
jgi:hypothetical protein